MTTTINFKDGLNTLNEMGTKGYDRMTSLGELNVKVLEKLAARQMDVFNLLMEQGMRQMTLATESKGYNDFVKGQIEIAKENGERIMTETKTNMALANEVRDEYRTWVQTNATEVAAEMRKAVPAA